MRIVIATAVYYPMINGVAVFSHNLAVGLAARGHEVMVVCPSQTGRSYTRVVDGVKTVYLKSVEAKIYPDQIHAVPERRRVLGMKLPRVFYKHGFRVSVFPAREVRRVLGEFQPDVVHVQVSDPIGLSVVSYARKHGIPVVTTEHNQPEVLTEPLHLPGVVRKPVNALLSAYFANRQSKSDFVTMPTKQAIYNLLSGRDFKVPVAAVSNGVDLTQFKAGRASAEIYQKYGVDKARSVVLYVGRVDPEKKVGLVIEAFLRARKELPGIQLVIVGDGVDRLRLEREYARECECAGECACEEGHEHNDGACIRFLGRVVGDDLYEIYRMGDVFVTASEIETQGIVLIEAAASGLPLIAVDAGAVKEICVDGENGYLCRPRDVSEISTAIVKILSNEKLRKKFAATSVKLAHEHDFERTLDRFINIYNRVLSRNADSKDRL